MQPTPSARKGDRLFTKDFLLVSFAGLATFANMSLLIPTLPLYVIQVGGKRSDIGVIVAAFAITSVALRPFVGQAVDRRGSKGMMVAGGLLVVLSAALYLLANTIPLLLALRALHGVGMAVATTAALAFVAEAAPPHRRGEAMGVFGMFMSLSFVLGPMTGSFLADTWGFQALFIGMTILSVVGLLLMLPVSASRPTAIAHPGGVSLSGLISRSALLPSVLFLAMAGTFAPQMAFLPLFAAERSLGVPGVYFAVQAASLFVSRTVGGKLSDIYGRIPVIVPSVFLLAGGVTLLGFSTSPAMFFGAAVLTGLGAGAVQPVVMAFAIDRAPEQERGASMATLTAFLDLGIGVGAVLLGMVLEVAGFTAIYVGAGVAALLALAVFLVGLRVRALPVPVPR